MATREQCRQALDQHADTLASRANVVGMGIVAATEDPTMSTELAVGVYVRRKLPAADLPRRDLLPKRLALSGHAESVEVPVRVIEQGEPELESFETEPL